MELADLYQELILDHNRSPRNRRRPERPTRRSEGYNPLCGDKIIVYLVLEDDVVSDIAFEGSGCAISTAAASLMTQAVKGRTLEEVQALFRKYHDLVAAEPPPEDPDAAGGPPLGKLGAFAGVRRYPARVKCATLAWHTLKAAMDDRHDTVTTE